MIATLDRGEQRAFLRSAWRKACDGSPLQPLEALVADVITAHPEYHGLLEDDGALDIESVPQGGETNPFLHIGLHIALREQLSIDRPPGIREACEHLAARLGDPHDAEHHLIGALAETLREAQQTRRPPDVEAYMARVRRLLQRCGA